MRDLSLNAGGSLSFAAVLISQSLVIAPMLIRGFARDQRVMDHFQHQPPFMRAAVGIAIAAGWTRPTLPCQNLIQWPAEQRLLIGDAAHKFFRVLHVGAHFGVASIVGRGEAGSLIDLIARFRRAKFNLIME